MQHSSLPSIRFMWLRQRLRIGLTVLALVPGMVMATTTINHSFTPSTIEQGNSSDYTIEIVNDNTGAGLTDVNLTSLLQSGGNAISIVSMAANTCGGSLAAGAGDTALVLTGGAVAQASNASSPGRCTITVKVSSTKTGNQTVTIPANTVPSSGTAGLGFTEGGVANQHNTTPANATLLVTSLQPPTGSKVFSPSPSYIGLPTRLSITLSNPNSGATMPLTSFTDTLPTGMVVAGTPNAAVACTGTGFVNGGVTATAGGSAVTLTGGTIGQSGSCTVTVDVVVPSGAATYNNVLAAGSIGNTRGLTSPGFNKSLTVSAPMAVTKGFNPDTVPVGKTSEMTIVVTNNGGVPLTNTSFTDLFPSDKLELVSVGTPICTSGTSGTATRNTTVSPHQLGYTGGTVAANGGTCTITAQVKPLAETQYTNSLPVGAITNTEGIGSPAVSANLQAYAQLLVDKTVSPSNVAPGQWATFSVRIRNYAAGAVTNAVFTDTLPVVGTAPNARPMEVDLSASPAGCDFNFITSGSNPVELKGTGGSIPAASGTTPGECTVTFRARPPSNAGVGTTFTNSLPTNDAVTGTGPGNAAIKNTNTSSKSLAVIDAVDLSKSFSPNSIAAGQTSQLTITVFNRTVNSLTGINLTDNLPAGLTLAANPNASTTCTGGSLQAYPGDNKVTLNGATAPARPGNAQEASCTVTVSVTGTTPKNSYQNTIKPIDFTSSAGAIPGDRSDTLTITAGLSAAKQFQPGRVATGGVVRAIVAVTNQSNGTLTNVSINDDGLAAGLVVANPANAATSCSGAPVITANPGTTGVRLDGAVLPAGASCELSFDVLAASGSGPWTNTLGAGKVTSAEGPTNSQVVTSTLISETASLALNKQFNPLIVTGNQPSVLTIDVVNTSALPISNVAFTDVFPQGIQVYPTPNTRTTCTGGTVAATPGSGQVSLTGAQLAAGQACQVQVTVTSVAFLNLTNTIPAGAVSSQGGYTNTTPTSATLSTLQGLGVSKGFEPAYVAPNAVSRLKIRLVNSFDPNIINPTVLTGVSYTDQLPPGLVFAAVHNATSTCTGAKINLVGNAVTLSGVTLVPGAVCDLEVNVTAAGLGQYLNSIPPGGVTTDQGVSNPAPPAEATLNVVPGPDISKSFSKPLITVGEKTELIVTVINNASVPLTGVKLTDNLPPGMAVANPSDSSTTCAAGSVTASPGASSITLQGATVPANASCIFRAFVVANKPGKFTNTIGKDAITSDQKLTNGNPAEAPVEVLSPPGISKSFTPAQIASAGTSTLRIRLGNDNATDITLTRDLVDALPGKVFVHGTPNVNGSLGGSNVCPGTVTAAAGAVSLSYPKNAVIPAGGCTISVDVTSSVMGNYLNTIAAGQLETSAGKNPEPANATLGVDKPAAPSVNKAFNPTTIDQGATSRLTITLGNPNTSELTLASAMTDTLPTNVVVAAAPAVAGTCTASSVTALAGDSKVEYAAGAKIPPAGCTITVNVTSSVAGSYTNTIPVGGLSTVEAGGNPTPANAGLVVRTPTDPTVLKAFSPSTINPGGVSKLIITLGNANATAATLTADLVDNLPADVLVASTPAIGGTCTPKANIEAVAGGSRVAYKTGASIPTGGCTIEVNVTSAKSGGPYVNTIATGDLQTSLGTNGAPARAELIVNPGQPPSVSKSFAPAAIVAGQQSTLTISLGNGNAGPLTLTADMTDVLTNMTAVIPADTTGTTCNAASVVVSAGAVTYRVGGVIPAGGCVIAVKVTSSTVIAAPGHPNTIAVGGLKTDGGDNTVPAKANLVVTSGIPAAIASIAGTVYHDRNNNGSIDPGEEGIAGVVIHLMQGGVIVAMTTTGPDGKYQFTNLVPGTYTVVEVHPSGWIDGKDTAGSHGGTAGNDVISNVTLGGGINATDYNFGERKPPGGVAIPTLSEWGLILMSALMGLMALWQVGALRRRS